MAGTYFIERKRCPVCGGEPARTVYECAYDRPPISDYLQRFYGSQGMVETQYLVGASYVLNECGDCRSLYQRDIPNDFLMMRLYEHWIDAARAEAAQQELDDLEMYSHYAQEVMQIVAWMPRRPGGLRVLDHGMGWGKWALMCKAFGCRASGTELSPTRIAYAKSNGIDVIAWDDLPNHRFDFINTEQVFEHLPDVLGTLKHLRRALDRGGLIKVSVPNAHDIDRRLEKLDWAAPVESSDSLNAVAPLEHINCIRRTSFATMAERAGMVEVEMPLSLQYAYNTDWSDARKVAKNLARPVYRNVLKRQNYVFLRAVD